MSTTIESLEKLNKLVKRVQYLHDGRPAISINMNNEAYKGLWDDLEHYSEMSGCGLDEIGAEVWFQTFRAEIYSALPDIDFDTHHDYQGAHIILRDNWREWGNQIESLQDAILDCRMAADAAGRTAVGEEIEAINNLDEEE